MKMSFGKKLTLFLFWLMSLVLAALAVGLCVWPELMQEGVSVVNRLCSYADIIGIALLGVYVLLAVLSVVFIFAGGKKRGERGFITVDSSEAGRTRIAIGAVDQMIRQAVRSVDGIVDMKSSIVNCEDAISINANVTIASGAHVPTVTMNMQRAVRSYIELNCGVAVREVCVNVSALENNDENGKHGRRKAASPVAAPAIQPPVATQAPEANDSAQEEIRLTLETPVSEETPAEAEMNPEADEASE